MPEIENLGIVVISSTDFAMVDLNLKLIPYIWLILVR